MTPQSLPSAAFIKAVNSRLLTLDGMRVTKVGIDKDGIGFVVVRNPSVAFDAALGSVHEVQGRGQAVERPFTISELLQAEHKLAQAAAPRHSVSENKLYASLGNVSALPAPSIDPLLTFVAISIRRIMIYGNANDRPQTGRLAPRVFQAFA